MHHLKTSVVSEGYPNQWRISIWKESMQGALHYY